MTVSPKPGTRVTTVGPVRYTGTVLKGDYWLAVAWDSPDTPYESVVYHEDVAVIR